MDGSHTPREGRLLHSDTPSHGTRHTRTQRLRGQPQVRNGSTMNGVAFRSTMPVAIGYSRGPRVAPKPNGRSPAWKYWRYPTAIAPVWYAGTLADVGKRGHLHRFGQQHTAVPPRVCAVFVTGCCAAKCQTGIHFSQYYNMSATSFETLVKVSGSLLPGTGVFCQTARVNAAGARAVQQSSPVYSLDVDDGNMQNHSLPKDSVLVARHSEESDANPTCAFDTNPQTVPVASVTCHLSPPPRVRCRPPIYGLAISVLCLVP